MGKEEKMSVNRDMNKEEKLKALDAALTQIEKAYGKGSVMKLGESGVNMNIETVPTGSISLDIALGLGGVPKGRIIEVYAVLASDSKFCLLDEPFSFMMPLHVQKMKEVIQREKKRKGIVITDHYFEDVIDISDELFILRSGKIWRVNGREDLELLGYIRNTNGVQDR